jgi:hypothetical protein
MKNWKITNKSNQPIKIGMIISNTNSKGIILQPSEFCICKPQLTASIDSQKRKGFITVDENFDNSVFNLEEGVAHKTSKMEEAERNAVEYIKKK